MKKILMILTSHSSMEETDSQTGVWLGEFTDPYFTLADAGYEITLASPQGGEPPVDPMSKLTENITTSNRRFNEDELVQHKFKNTLTLQEVDAVDFTALFFPGGHGPMWDLAHDEKCAKHILSFVEAGKPVAAVCHGPAALLPAAAQQPGLLQGKRLTAFTNTEEKLVFRNGNIPFHLEDRLQEAGADFHSAMVPFTNHVEEDGWLLTGQNPASAGPVAERLVKKLEETV